MANIMFVSVHFVGRNVVVMNTIMSFSFTKKPRSNLLRGGGGYL